MKLGFKGLALLAMIFFSFHSGAQTDIRQDNVPLTTKELSDLEEIYGNRLQDRVLSRPNVLAEIKDILRNRIDIIELNDLRDQKPCTLLSQVALYKVFNPEVRRDRDFNPSTFNPLKYAFNYRLKGASIYRVDDTNYFIVIKARSIN